MSQMTFRQSQVAAGFSDGMTVKAIARSLDICESTVDTHLLHIRERLGVFNNRDLRKRLLADRTVGQVYNLNERLGPTCFPTWLPLPVDPVLAEPIRQQFTVYDIVRKA